MSKKRYNKEKSVVIKVIYSLKINNLTKLYTNNKGIKDINLNLEEGSITTILGPSGAGKTTLLYALLNDQFKDKGSVSFYDYNLKDNYEDIMEMVGYLEDKLPTYPNLSLKEIFKNLNRYYNLDYYDNALKYLNMFNIDVNKKINELTSGEFKLINIIKALFHEPKFVFLDEATNNLDQKQINILKDILKRLKANDRTILLCSHNLSFTKDISDNIYLLKDMALKNITSIIKENNYKKITLVLNEYVDYNDFKLKEISSLMIDNKLVSFLYKGNLKPLLKKIASLDIESLEINEPTILEIIGDNDEL